MQEPEVSRGRTVEVLGPGFVEPKCVERRPVGTRAEPPRSPADPASGDWIRGTCDMHRRDRLDGIRLGYSVGPGRFSRPFPDDLPELLADGGTNRTAAPPTRPNPEPPGAETRTPAPPLGNAVRVEVGGTPVAVFNVGGDSMRSERFARTKAVLSRKEKSKMGGSHVPGTDRSLTSKPGRFSPLPRGTTSPSSPSGKKGTL